MIINQPQQTPNPKILTTYKAIIKQSGTDAPTSTILQNNTNLTITTERESTGQYLLNLSTPIDPDKTLIIFPNNVDNVQNVAAVIILNDDQLIRAIRLLVCDLDGTPRDNALNSNTLIIEIYN